MNNISKEKQELIDAYIFANKTDAYDRASISKKITKYNKANKHDKLKMSEVFKLRYPALYSYLTKNGTIDPDTVFENKFTKRIMNIGNKLTPNQRRASAYHSVFSKDVITEVYVNQGVLLQTSCGYRYKVVDSNTNSYYYLTLKPIDNDNMPDISGMYADYALFSEIV
jgi:hypothetical protein